jgi:predicted flap endonuclease-1-like 5' DNA nuclease
VAGKADGEFAEIGAPARRALASVGISTLEDVAHAKAADLAKLHGMGPKALRILREKLLVRGLTFSDDR